MVLLILRRRIYPANLVLSPSSHAHDASLFSSPHVLRGDSYYILFYFLVRLVFARPVISIVNFCVFALSASDFLLLAQMKVTKEKCTPNRFLIQIINCFYNAPALAGHPWPERASPKHPVWVC